MRSHSLLFAPFIAVCLAGPLVPAAAQEVANAVVTPVALPTTDLTYQRPTEISKFHSYALATVGPYPVAIAFGEAAVDQFDNSPPEWKQGVAGYSKRFGSDFGIEGVSTTTRYALAEALREDTRYYRCDCTGLFPRFRYAVFSTLTARHGDDGRRIFSV